MKLHKKVFICCDNDKPEEKGVLATQMEWDDYTEKGDKELMNAEKMAKVHETRAEIKEALAKAREIAEGLAWFCRLLGYQLCLLNRTVVCNSYW